MNPRVVAMNEFLDWCESHGIEFSEDIKSRKLEITTGYEVWRMQKIQYAQHLASIKRDLEGCKHDLDKIYGQRNLRGASDARR